MKIPHLFLTDIAGVRVRPTPTTRYCLRVTAVISMRGGGGESTCAAAGRGASAIGAVLDLAIRWNGRASRCPALGVFGLEIGGRRQAWLAEQGVALRLARARSDRARRVFSTCPNGGERHGGVFPPYRELGLRRAAAAEDDLRTRTRRRIRRPPRRISRAGSARLGGDPGRRSGRGAAWVNAVGSVTVGDDRGLAAPFEIVVSSRPRPASIVHAPDAGHAAEGRRAATAAENTTLAGVVTDADPHQAAARRLAMIAQTGCARCDLSGAPRRSTGRRASPAATGEQRVDPFIGLPSSAWSLPTLWRAAIARGVYEAPALPFPDALRVEDRVRAGIQPLKNILSVSSDRQ